MGNGNLLDKLFHLFSGTTNSGDPKVTYSSNGRSGYVHYQSGKAGFAMYYEFCGGNCVAGINIPNVENWEDHTGLSLAHRDEVLDFIGRQVVNDQTSGGKGYFKIEGDWLNIYV